MCYDYSIVIGTGLPSFSGVVIRFGGWLINLLFIACVMNYIAAAMHVEHGCIAAVTGLLIVACEAGVQRVASSSMGPAVVQLLWFVCCWRLYR
jgi:hypothetical protein